MSFVKNKGENSGFCCRESRLIWMQPHSGYALSAITLSPRRQIIGGSVVPPNPPNSSMPSCLRGAYTGAGLTADRGQHIITSDEYGGGPLGFCGSTAKNDNEGVHPTPTNHPPTRCHLIASSPQGPTTLSSQGCNWSEKAPLGWLITLKSKWYVFK